MLTGLRGLLRALGQLTAGLRGGNLRLRILINLIGGILIEIRVLFLQSRGLLTELVFLLGQGGLRLRTGGVGDLIREGALLLSQRLGLLRQGLGLLGSLLECLLLGLIILRSELCGELLGLLGDGGLLLLPLLLCLLLRLQLFRGAGR